MVTILRNEDDSGRQLGTALGGALGAGLGALASRKVEKMTHKEESSRLQSLGFSPKLADAFPKLPQKTQEEILSSVDWGRINSTQQQQQRPIQQQEQQRMQQPQQQQMRQPQQQPQQQQGQPVPQQNVPRDLQQMNRPDTQDILRSLSGQGARQQPFGQQEQQFAAARQQNPQDQLTPNQQIGQAAAQQQVAEKEAEAQGIFKPKVDENQQKMQLEDYKQQRKAQHELALYERKRMDEKEDKSTEWYKNELKSSHGHKENLARLNRQEKLNKEGKLTHNVLTSISDTIGHGIGGKFGGAFIGIPGVDLSAILTSPESQEFNKLSKDMLSGLKDMYGGRINQTEVESFLQTIPSLSQSPAGRQAVIENMRRFTEDRLAAVEEAKKIKQENGGKIPADLQLLVEERIGDRLDKTVEDFKNLTHSKEGKGEGLIKGLLKSIPRAIL
jgi:hypothetical protein